ncbi:MAG: hypothetical protein K0R67_2666, partial [Paenibacillus sp.]|nr:hypothetical protein [Paenibacillus sp.]
FHISYLEAAGRVEGKWTVPFKLETAIAKQNTYKKALTGQFADAGRSQHLAELVVTPSMIKVNTIAEGFDDNWKELFTYGKHQLQVGDQLIAGGMFAEGEGFSYRFEVPTSLKLTGEPMKMILSGLRIQKRGGMDYQVKLGSPSLAKQSVTTVMDGFEVRYTYYRDGNDLVVETSSDDANFGGIVQTVVLENGNKIDAYKREMQGPRWMSGNSSFERYAGLGEEDITIYPFTYSIYDPNAKLELPLIP